MKNRSISSKFFLILEREMGFPKEEPPIDKFVEAAIRLRNTGSPLVAVQADHFCDTVWWAINENITRNDGSIPPCERRALGLINTTQNALNN